MTYSPRLDAAPTDLEERVGVESLEVLHAERRVIIEKLAPLELLFGSGGDRWTAIRRQHRDGIAKRLLVENAGLSDKKLETMANADPQHKAFCESTEAKYTDYMKWKTALSEVEERIDSRKAEMYHVAAEARLAI